MSSVDYQVRRATLDDLGALTALWRSMSFDPDELARRITEFQVAVSAEGNILGAVALQIVERQGLIHSECFNDFGLAEGVRPAFWARVETLAANHGLLRVWTQESAPFWGRCGLTNPDEAALASLPTPWRALPSSWLTLKLRDDVQALLSADKELAAFMALERQRRDRTLAQAKVLKYVVAGLAIAVLLGLLVGVVLMFWRTGLRHR